MSRLTQRNYYGKPFVPGYAPRCADATTCELLCKVTERLALLEDALEKCPNAFLALPTDFYMKLKKEGVVE